MKAVQNYCDVAFFPKVYKEHLLLLDVLRFDFWLIPLNEDLLEAGNDLG
jgi:hypothetical protein